MESELTRAQIEGEGWTHIRTNNKNQYYEKGLYGLHYNEATNAAFFSRIDINSIRGYRPNVAFSGTCKDLKTFKYVCKMANI